MKAFLFGKARLSSMLVLSAAVLLEPGPVRAGGRRPTMQKMPGLRSNFIENCGQWEGRTRFIFTRGALSAQLEGSAINIHHPEDRSGSSSVRLTFEGALKDALVTGEGNPSGHYNFYF